MAPRTELTLAVIRHAESTENATKPPFYRDPRPWTGPAAHALSRDLVGLTPRGFEQCLWLRRTLPDLVGPDPAVRTSQYRRAQDTAALALPGLPSEATAALNEQHYGDATYMTKRELFATYPEGAEDRRLRKHLWTPPGEGGESLAGGVLRRASAFVTALPALASTAAAAQWWRHAPHRDPGAAHRPGAAAGHRTGRRGPPPQDPERGRPALPAARRALRGRRRRRAGLLRSPTMTLFLNGPVQNGPFTLAERPGKAAGIRLAEALNQLTGAPARTAPVEHRHARRRPPPPHRRQHPGRRPRGQWERRELAAKYAPGPTPAAGILTDTAPQVAALALRVCQELLATGTLALAPVQVRLCLGCDHMTGEADHACRACATGAGTRPATRRLLVHDRPEGRPVLERADFHAYPVQHTGTPGEHRAQRPAPAAAVTHPHPRHQPRPARAGRHGARPAAGAAPGRAGRRRAARRGPARHDHHPERRRNVAAYGALLRRWSGMQLRYALHGRIPYDEPASAAAVRGAPRHSAATEAVHRVVPAAVLTARARRHHPGPAPGPAEILPPRRPGPARDTRDDVLAELRRSAAAGDLRWVMDARVPGPRPRSPHGSQVPQRNPGRRN